MPNSARQGDEQNNILFVNQGARPSRFLVDLNATGAEEKAAPARSGQVRAWYDKFDFWQRLKKKKRIKPPTANGPDDFEPIAVSGKAAYDTSADNPVNDDIDAEFVGYEDNQPAFSLKNSVKKAFDKFQLILERHCRRLIFYPVFKYGLKAFARILEFIFELSYSIGWLALFAIRFCLLLGLGILRLPLKFRPERKYVQRKMPRTSINDQDIARQSPARKILTKRENESVSAETAKVENSSGGSEMGIVQKLAAPDFSRLESFNLETEPVIPERAQAVVVGKNPETTTPRKRSKKKQHHKARFRFKKLLPVGNTFSYRPLVVFAAILFIAVMPLKAFTYYHNLRDLQGQVLGESESALSDLKTASQAAADMNFTRAGDEFDAANRNFAQAQAEIGQVGGILTTLASLIPNNQAQLAAQANNILEAGRLSSDIGTRISQALAYLSSDPNRNIEGAIDTFYTQFGQAAADADKLQTIISQIDPQSLPPEYRDQFAALKDKAGTITSSLSELDGLITLTRSILGFEYDKRYLLVFQNNTEMRASGGFIGSYALADFHNGNLTNLEVPGGGSYDTAGGMLVRVKAPQPLWIVNPLWHFWDANWWPDWPTTARKLEWFYVKSGGPTVDGVISLTPTVIERILKVTGPIDLTDKYGIVIDADNFWQLTQEIVEQKPPATLATTTAAGTASGTPPVKNEPKKIIGDMLNKLMAELPARLNKQTFVGLAQAIMRSVQEKQIMFYFDDPSLEKKISSLGWDGAMADTVGDYLMVVDTNVAGGKSDKAIKEDISHNAEVADDGTVIDTVTIKRTHTAAKGTPFTGVRNNDWMRIYVPEGSELISASGFKGPAAKYFQTPDPSWQDDPDLAAEDQAAIDPQSGTKIYNEDNKTVFANWSQVDPGESITVTLTYRLPFKVAVAPADTSLMGEITAFLNPDQKQLAPYSFLAQKQPGSLDRTITSTLSLPAGYDLVSYYPSDQGGFTGQGWNITDNLAADKYWAALIEVGK